MMRFTGAAIYHRQPFGGWVSTIWHLPNQNQTYCTPLSLPMERDENKWKRTRWRLSVCVNTMYRCHRRLICVLRVCVVFGFSLPLVIQPQSAKQWNFLSSFSVFGFFVAVFGAKNLFQPLPMRLFITKAKRQLRLDRDKMTFWNIYRVETRMAALSNRWGERERRT